MSGTYTLLAATTPLPTSGPAILYTAMSATYLLKSSFTNITASDVTVTIYLVPLKGSANAASTVTYQKNVPAGTTLNLADLSGHVMAANSTLQAVASAASSINATISGVVF